MDELTHLKYPIGHFQCPTNITTYNITEWTAILEMLPNRLSALVSSLDDDQLNTVYRPGGWTVRQVIHHIADSHHNSYTRFKWTLTENTPMIKAYDEKEWSKLFDANEAPIQLSLTYIAALHAKLVYLIKGLSEEQLSATFIHPANNKEKTLAANIGTYAWHSEHHYAHIANLIKRKGW